HNARKIIQDHLDTAQQIHTPARTVHVAHADGNSLDGTRMLSKHLAEPSSDVHAVVVIERDAVHSNVGGNLRCARAAHAALHGSRHDLSERSSLLARGRAGGFAT